MNWHLIRTTLRDVISLVVGADTVWRKREQPFVRPEDSVRSDRGVLCRLHIFGLGQYGTDDIRQEHVGSKLVLHQAGHRKMTLSCLVEAYDQSDDRQALEYTERIRSRVQRPQILALLRAAGLTVSKVEDSVDLEISMDDHDMSTASVDIHLLYANNETSADGPGLEDLGWIETVEGTRSPPLPDPTDTTPAPIDDELAGRHTP